MTRKANAIIVGVFSPKGMAHTSARFSRRESRCACQA